MGTRSLTHVIDKNGDILLTIYRQMDGYPRGHGKDLLDFIKGGKLVNGFHLGNGFGEVFNGIDDFAAQLVVHLKGYDVGGIYIEKPGSSDMGEDYTYTIRETDEGLKLTFVETGTHAIQGEAEILKQE